MILISSDLLLHSFLNKCQPLFPAVPELTHLFDKIRNFLVNQSGPRLKNFILLASNKPPACSLCVYETVSFELGQRPLNRIRIHFKCDRQITNAHYTVSRTPFSPGNPDCKKLYELKVNRRVCIEIIILSL